MTAYEPLTDMDTDGFPELVQRLADAMDDLLGDQFDLDKPALAVELADTAWKQLRGWRHDGRAEVVAAVEAVLEAEVERIDGAEALDGVGITLLRAALENPCRCPEDGRSCSCADREGGVGW